jgi:iron complex transport system substrate-binding protein
LLKPTLKRRFSPLGLVAALLLALLLAACGDNTPTPVPAPATSAAAVATTAPATTAPAATTAATTTAAVTTAPATTAAISTVAATTAPATTALATTTVPATTAPAITTASATTAITGSSAPTNYPLTITDDAKRSVKFDKAPAKIVSLAPSNTELAYTLGLGDKVVAVDDNSNYPPDVSAKPKVGGFTGINLEKIVSLSPDMVLVAGITSKDAITSLEQQKLTVVVLNPANLAGIVTNLQLLGQIENVPDKAAAAVAAFQNKLAEVSAKVSTVSARQRVFYELDPTLFTVGPGSFIDEIISKAGGQNIVTDTSNPYPQLNQEAVVSKDPQVILVGDDTGGTDTPELISARPGWQVISAVKNKRVFAVSADLVNRPGPRAPLGVEAVAKLLYPDLFK